MAPTSTARGGKHRNEQQCSEFLKRTQAGLISSLQNRLDENKKIELCLLGTVSFGCSEKQTEHLEQLRNYEAYRQAAVKTDIAYQPIDGDFFSVRSANSTVRNGLGRSLSNLGNDENKAVWNDFEKFENGFLNSWWQNQSKSQFPNWKECIKFENEKISLARKRKSHVFLPEFREDTIRQYRSECAELRAYWQTAPFAVPLTYAYRKGTDAAYQKISDGTHDRVRKLNESFKPWVYLLHEDLSSKDKAGKLAAASIAYNKLNGETKKFADWVKSLNDGNLDQLLVFSNVKEQLNGDSFCEGYSKKSTFDLIKEIGTSAIPGSDIFENIFFADPKNDRAFLAGFIGYDEWDKEKERLNRTTLLGAFKAVPQYIAESAAFQKAIEVAGPVVKRALNKSFSNLMPKYHVGSPLEGQPTIGSVQQVKPNPFTGSILLKPRREANSITQISEDGKFIETTSPANVKNYFRVTPGEKGKQELRRVSLKATPFDGAAEKRYVDDQFISNLKGSFDPKTVSSEDLARRLTNAQKQSSTTVLTTEGNVAEDNLLKMNTRVVEKMRSGRDLTVDDLESWNGIVNRYLLKGDFRNGAGQIRGTKKAGYVRGRKVESDLSSTDAFLVDPGQISMKFLPAEQVPKRLNSLIGRVNSLNSKSSLRVVAEIYQEYIKIHPFVDGNGRTARALVDYSLSKMKLPPVPEGRSIPRGALYQSPDELAATIRQLYEPKVVPKEVPRSWDVNAD
jgi:fido (protein-threonine AMPylation protein)